MDFSMSPRDQRYRSEHISPYVQPDWHTCQFEPSMYAGLTRKVAGPRLPTSLYILTYQIC